jgi:hypothetical protein
VDTVSVRAQLLKSGVVLPAIAAALAAEAVFVARTGSEHLVALGDLWRAQPVERALKARWWRVSAPWAPAVCRRLVDAPLPGRRAAIGRLGEEWVRQQMWRAEAETWVSRLR